MIENIKALLLLAFLFCLSSTSQSDVKNSSGGFLDFNIYPYLRDVDEDNVITINIGAKLPKRFSYFSLTNFGNVDNKSELKETTSYYTEQNIRWQVAENSPIDLTAQMNFRTGDDNDRHRLGVRWRLNDTEQLKSLFNAIHLSYSINLHAIQFDNEDGHVWQMEHVFKLTFPYISDRLYLAGFIDHTFNQDLPSEIPSNPIVGEAQLGFRLVENLFVVTEYRVNQYRRSDVNNLAVGVQYKIVW